MCRKLVYLVIVVVFMAGISVQAEVVTYDFDDGTLQGWSNYEGTTEEEFVVQDNWQVRSPNNMLNLTGFYISIALTRAYATCHSERSEESQTRNGTKSCSSQSS